MLSWFLQTYKYISIVIWISIMFYADETEHKQCTPEEDKDSNVPLTQYYDCWCHLQV